MNKKKGFTLIELIIVIAVIGILAAVAVPSFTEYRAKSLDAIALTNMTYMRNKLEELKLDLQGSLPRPDTVQYLLFSPTGGIYEEIKIDKGIFLNSEDVLESYAAFKINGATLKGTFRSIMKVGKAEGRDNSKYIDINTMTGETVVDFGYTTDKNEDFKYRAGGVINNNDVDKTGMKEGEIFFDLSGTAIDSKGNKWRDY